MEANEISMKRGKGLKKVHYLLNLSGSLRAHIKRGRF
jgi:hypothetical protein